MDGYTVGWQSADVGRASAAVAYLSVKAVPGARRSDILQGWNNKGALSLVAFTPAAGSALGETWYADSMAHAPAALAFLTGRFPPSGLTQVMQLCDHGGKLGIIVYNPTGDATRKGAHSVYWWSDDMGQSSAAIAFLTADLDGSGKTSIVQLRDNKGRLGMVVYTPIANSTYAVAFAADDIAEGSQHLAFLALDMNGDGKTEIVQLWDNAGKLGMLVYAPNGKGGYARAWGNPSIGPSSANIGFHAVDSAGDKKARIVQLQSNAGELGMAVYAPDGRGGFTAGWSTARIGRPAAAIKFLAADVNGDGKTELVQLWNNGGQLGMNVYAPDARGGYATSWASPSVGKSAAAIAFLAGDDGSGKAEIVQLQDNGGRLGMVVYSPVQIAG